MRQSFVVGCKKIEIPGYKFGFNPSIVKWKSGYLLSFRHLPDEKHYLVSHIALVPLDKDFNPCGNTQLLNTREHFPYLPNCSEDARLFWVDKSLHIIYGDCKEHEMKHTRRRLWVGRLECKGDLFSLAEDVGLMKIDEVFLAGCEKNWAPFDYNGDILLSYSLNPHQVLHCSLKSTNCSTVGFSRRPEFWKWGILRGGTPALRVGDDYLGFFHSSINMATVQSGGQMMKHYFMGAYTFSNKPPFKIKSVSSEPIVAPEFYAGPPTSPCWGRCTLRCVFPGGFVMDDLFIYVVFGRQDHEMWIVKLEKRGLLESLKKVY